MRFNFVGGLSFATPGLDNKDVTGIGPAFNESVGIFYLEEKPVILHQQISGNLNEQYKNFRQEIVAVDPDEGKTLTEAKIYCGNVLKASAPLDIHGVRVSFEVVPKNGSAPVKIIKTFKADVHNS